MGQKVHPIGFRIGVIRDWESKWFAGKDYGDLLLEDVKIREYLKKKLKDSALSHVEIERASNRVNVTIHTAKPGMVIGKGGAEVEVIRNHIASFSNKKVHINISEIKYPDLVCCTSCREHCSTIGASRIFPSCHEASIAKNNEIWSKRYQNCR